MQGYNQVKKRKTTADSGREVMPKRVDKMFKFLRFKDLDWTNPNIKPIFFKK